MSKSKAEAADDEDDIASSSAPAAAGAYPVAAVFVLLRSIDQRSPCNFTAKPRKRRAVALEDDEDDDDDGDDSDEQDEADGIVVCCFDHTQLMPAITHVLHARC